jgi:hypothetical protein
MAHEAVRGVLVKLASDHLTGRASDEDLDGEHVQVEFQLEVKVAQPGGDLRKTAVRPDPLQSNLCPLLVPLDDIDQDGGCGQPDRPPSTPLVRLADSLTAKDAQVSAISGMRVRL